MRATRATATHSPNAPMLLTIARIAAWLVTSLIIMRVTKAALDV